MPTSCDKKTRWYPPEDPGEEIVISGTAGRYPDSNNMTHFEENLRNKVDLISDDDRRWKLDHPEIPQRTGKINNVGKFDALFFGVHFKQAHTMDPMCRMLLEHTYEAIIDAGINPRQLRGSNTGVFIGACFSESEKTWFYEKLQVNGFGITGCSRAMLANRISYWLGVNGPSYTVDSACSSGLFAMENAYRAMRDGLCDSAIVGGANLCLHPYVSLQFSRLGVLSPDGRSKSFDANADGYCRSEAIGVVFLQRARDARRIYARFIHAKINCDGYKEQGITFPSSIMQSVLLQDFYRECGVDPRRLAFVEAHGTGTKVGDPEEANALDKVFCTGRDKPLLIGSIKSNLGHSEPASGMCSLAKVIVCMESGDLMPNLHYNRPREGVKALEEGRIKVVTEVTPWEGGYVGVNSFGFGGANAHVLLKSNDKEKTNNGAPSDDLPRVVAVSGRTEEAVNVILNDLESRPVDVEYVRLYHEIHADVIPGHLYRGYTVLPPRGRPDPPMREVQNFPGGKRQVWFVFSGMGSQWAGMGEALLRLPVFAEAIRKCHVALKPKGIDIYDILTSKDKSMFDNILNSFVGIAAVQIGLVDVLWSLGIEPDRIIGHSVGELGCAYADRCFTAEQMILSAYSRGLASIETKFIRGSMAAVGMGFTELEEICPPDIEIACHNGPESSTISGPAESMKAFVAKLQDNNIFAREVPCSNIAYHSRYIANAGPKLLAYLKQVIPDPKPRSPKWLSTSVPRSEWNTPRARFSSAEYHTNNLLSPVLFEETSIMIPKNAITIEIAPHGLLQAILRRSMPPTVTNIGLTQRCHRDNVEVLAQALGRLYVVGLQPNLATLYPKVEFPVSRGTPGISSLIRWEHSDDWYVTAYRMQEKIDSGERVVEIALADEDFEYMGGHVIDGRNLLPATGYLDMVWQTLGMMRGELYTEVSVVFEDVKFLRATSLPKEGEIKLTVMLQKGTGRFEVVDGNAALVTGYVRPCSGQAQEEKVNAPVTNEHGEELMTSRDVYKELRLRGYHYTGLFKSILSADVLGTKGHIAWHNNWVAFMDNMLQMQILAKDSRGLFVPTSIQKVVIDSRFHTHEIRKMDLENRQFPVYVDKLHDTIVSGGIEIRGLKASAIARRKPAGEPVLENYEFVAHYDHAEVSLNGLARLSTHLGLENHLGIKVKTIELLDDRDKIPFDQLMTPHLVEALGDMPLIQAEVILAAANPDLGADANLPSNVTVIEAKKIAHDANALLGVGYNLLSRARDENLSTLLMAVKEGGFLLTREAATNGKNPEAFASSRGLSVILIKRWGSEVYVLLRKREKVLRKTLAIRVENETFDWVDDMRRTMKEALETEGANKTRIVFVGQTNFENGLIGMVNCLRKEPGGEIVRGILIQDPKAPKFSLTEPLYAKQLEKDLAVSVLRPNGAWGSYRHWLLPAPTPAPVKHIYGNELVRADLSSLTWLEGPLDLDYTHYGDLVNVVYASLNFRDIMMATGKLAVEIVARSREQENCVLGFEFSGIQKSNNRRIMGVRDSKCLSNIVVPDPLLTWEVPKNWSLEDAATVPCVYATSYYALYVYGKMKKGDKVLIHAGTGGIGQAAINIALHEGCEVFTTVGTPEKRRFIREHFPQIPEDHIGNSRDCTFEQMIKTVTKGQGVDIVLNSLAEEKLLASVRCLGLRGRFLEIGKFDIAANNPLGMECFMKEVSFCGVMLDNLFYAGTEFKTEVNQLVAKGLKTGAIKPLTRTVFPKDQLESAFRYMAGGKHVGKVMIKMNDEKDASQMLSGLPRFYCRDDRSYVILGGLGGFGMELADWMVLRGARHLVLTSRNGIKNGYQRMRLELWKSYGVKVEIVQGKDASDKQDCQFILDQAAKMAPIDGIFNLAVVLKDGIWENQTAESFEESFRAKAWSTKTLDELSRSTCPLLRYFVVFSSVSCGRGNAGQTNYGMSNSVMERIVERRVAEGLPGLAVQWGAVGDVGLVADMQEDNKELVIGGTLQQRISSCIQELDYLLRTKYPIVSSMVVAEKRAGGAGALNMVDTVCNIMGIKDLKAVSQQTSLAEMGMDSMMAVEIKQTLEREFEVFLTAQDIRGLSFAKLNEMQARELALQQQRKPRGGQDENLQGMKLWLRTLGSEDVKDFAVHKLDTQNDEKRDEIFCIPGIEGFGSIFAGLAPKIKAPAVCLQFGLDEPSKTIPEMADRLLPEILKGSKGRREYILVGYSFGATVTIEIARKLEAEGYICRLVLIDGSPEQLKAIKDTHLSASTDEEFENNVLMTIMNLYNPMDNPEQLYEELNKCQNWQQKIEAFMKRPPVENVTVTAEEQTRICRAVINRLMALQAYDTSDLPPIRAPIILIKPHMAAVRNVSEDYGLGQLTKESVEICYVEGNHVTMLDSMKIAHAINGDPLEDSESFKARIFESGKILEPIQQR